MPSVCIHAGIDVAEVQTGETEIHFTFAMDVVGYQVTEIGGHHGQGRFPHAYEHERRKEQCRGDGAFRNRYGNEEDRDIGPLD